MLDRFEELLISSFLALATLISFLQVVLRYVFSSSITWAAEATTFLLIWTALIGASYGVRKNLHIGVDTFINLLPDRFYRVALLASSALCLIYTVTLSWLGIGFIRFMKTIGQLSPDLAWPMWIPFLAVPLGSLLMTLRFAQEAYACLRGPLHKKDVLDLADIPETLRTRKSGNTEGDDR